MVNVHVLHLPLANAYLLEGAHNLILVDCGVPLARASMFGALRRFSPKKLSLIVLTHAHIDHYGNALALREATGAKVAIHAADAELLRSGELFLGASRHRGKWLHTLSSLLEGISRHCALEADFLLEESSDLSAFGMDAYCLHTPGHTPGSICLLVEERLAFVGDLLSTHGEAHIQRYFAADWVALHASVKRLASLRPKHIFAGHGARLMHFDELEKLACSVR